jgi:hypothetical protein
MPRRREVPVVTHPILVMPGLVPGIHALLSHRDKNVDGRDKPGHDGRDRVESLKKN